MTPGRVHGAVEDLAVEAERDDALLDARAAALVDADDRAAVLHREVEHLDDLLAVHLAERAAEHGDVLAEDADRAAVDRAVAGDDAVAERAVLLHAEVGRAVPGELVELDERALVEQRLDALAGGHLALGVLLLDRPLRAGVHRLVVALLEFGELAGRGVRVGRGTDRPRALLPWGLRIIRSPWTGPRVRPRCGLRSLDWRAAAGRDRRRRRDRVDQRRPARRRSGAGPDRAGRRAPERRPGPARPQLGLAAAGRADLLGPGAPDGAAGHVGLAAAAGRRRAGRGGCRT